MLPNKILVSGIGTDVGKTLVCAALCRYLKYDYWKPVQCGDLDNSDSKRVEKLSPGTRIFSENYTLPDPLSPHHAASNAGIEIDEFVFPDSSELMIEGAGGLMVPITNSGYTYADFAAENDLPVILVSRNYLGSINHTLLSLEVMRNRKINLLGVVISGEPYQEGEKMYLTHDTRIIGRLPELEAESELHNKFVWYGLD